jgi:hypothetical protein
LERSLTDVTPLGVASTVVSLAMPVMRGLTGALGSHLLDEYRLSVVGECVWPKAKDMIFRFEGVLIRIRAWFLKIGLVLLVTRDVRNICRKNCAIDVI